MPSVAEVIIRVLEDNGIQRIYGIPGDSIDPLVDAIRKSKVKYVQVRHEEGAALAASVEAKITGKPSACMGTSGPGSIHLLNGLYDAKMDHAPVIALTGQVESDMIGHDYFQEVNLTKLFDDVAVYNQILINPENAEYIIRRAIREAISKRGVAHINLPVDILRKSSEYKGSKNTEVGKVKYSIDFSRAKELIKESEKPVLLIGGGTRGLGKEINRFAEKIGAPIIYTLNGKGILPDLDPKVMGGIGLLGTKPSIEAMDKADLLIMLGASFPYVNFLNKSAKVIQVDIDNSNIGKRLDVDLSYPIPVAEFLNIDIEEKSDKYYEELKGKKEDWLDSISKQENSLDKPMKPQRVAYIVSQKCKKDAVIVTDTGNVTMWTARHFRASGEQIFIFSAWLGSMGIGVPGSVGASFAVENKRQVISFVGDGGFTMTMMEMITAKKYDLPVKIIVYNNSKLGMIKFEQEVMGYPEWGVDLYNPDFTKIAESIGFKGFRLEEPKEAEEIIEDFLNTKGHALLDAIVDPNERPMPPKLTFKQAGEYVLSIFREKLEGI
ncbi:pyruvate oxidase [Saccharolobus islandicus]|uniref:2-oxoacid oxidoreductase (ferredoxin) n=3 Tax=Saccharolobus islandicus TaxID=43080 RepID=F0NHC9_SACI5|nr:pyruvate oxidase [Sulfolobus islandicus]ACP55156.1 thiamine pyrophosphate protein TPP binding domain protein [Sulfolobus islandicus M.16.27]ADX82514.1 thiamine pyrophosphate protein TPP binding domain protein [Sulfolobus islandicus HVE10/4]ADX85150.1 thiamine pyrophosphate protein TPP binding domain protein [Sulfolobus islandicus REY15A]WCM36201.1 pyruvate oxidase [Sulfolobus islandicus]